MRKESSLRLGMQGLLGLFIFTAFLFDAFDNKECQ